MSSKPAFGWPGRILQDLQPIAPPPEPAAPPAPATAELHTSIGGNTTTFRAWTPESGFQEVSIPSRVVVDHAWEAAHPGAGGEFTTNGIVGVSNRHAGDRHYGPAGAFIDVGDPRGRDMHGGGSRLVHPLAAEQGWLPTDGCTRGQNQDVQRLGKAISDFQRNHPGIAIPYRRTRP